MSNSLAAVHPELIAEWSEKNLPMTPDSITFGSNKKVWWKDVLAVYSVKVNTNTDNPMEVATVDEPRSNCCRIFFGR